MIPLNDLKKIPILSGLTTEELTNLSRVMQSRNVNRGATIMKYAEPGPNMMFISSGKVKVCLTNREGKEVLIATLGEGDFFGEISLITETPRSATIVALGACSLFVLNEADFNAHMEKFSGLSKAMLKQMALRLRAASHRIGDLALYDVYRRVARVLQSLGTLEKRGSEEVYVISSRPTHQDLAAMVGTSREMVTRALKGLLEDKCIKMNGRRVEVYKLPR